METLACQYTQQPPSPGAIAPADNVLICLAPIHACDGHPLASDPQNKESNEVLLSESHPADEWINWMKAAAGE